MSTPVPHTFRPVTRRLANSSLGQRLLGRDMNASQRGTVPFGSVAATSQGNGPISTEGSESVSTRFILLAEGRSGSALLINELDRRWTEIRTRGELFRPDKRGPSASFEEIASTAFADDTGASIVGFKAFSTQLTEQQFTALLELEGMRVVILRRGGRLRRYVSEQIARKTGHWRQYEAGKAGSSISLEERTITIDVGHLGRQLKISDDRYREFDRLTFRVPKIGVWYEDLVADLDGELRRVATFLGAGEPSLQTPPFLARQNPESLRNLITNYDEVAKFLRRTGRGELLTIGESETPGSESTPTSRR